MTEERQKREKGGGGRQIDFMVLSPNKESGFHVFFGRLINLSKDIQDFLMQLLKIPPSITQFEKIGN